MEETLKIWSTNVSRRAAIRGLTSAIVATPILLTTHSVFAAKMSKASVAYQHSPKGSQSCANCKLFVPPSSCTLVEGPISPRGWCKLWVGK
jgi:hypothetical protein